MGGEFHVVGAQCVEANRVSGIASAIDTRKSAWPTRTQPLARQCRHQIKRYHVGFDARELHDDDDVLETGGEPDIGLGGERLNGQFEHLVRIIQLA